MHFRIDLEIARPPEQVWAAFTDPTRLREWQATLKSTEPVTGRPGAVGSVTRAVYREGGRDIEMIETITEREDGVLLAQRLEAPMMTSNMHNRFTSPRAGVTSWMLECDIGFRGAWRLFGMLGRRLIIRKTREDMQRFRALVERSAAPGSGA